MPAHPVISVLVVAALLALASFGGLLWRRRDGQLRQIAPAPTGTPASNVRAELVAGGFGPVTLVQFSSAACAPCRVAHRICTQVAAEQPGVTHVEIDAGEHLDVARELGIWRTPTVLVVDGTGRVVHRASGVPARTDLLAAIAPMLVDV